MNDIVSWSIQGYLGETTEELVEQLLRNFAERKCIGCEIKFPLYWSRSERYWYHEDGGGGVVCECHPDNDEYWRKRNEKVQD